MVQTSVAQSAAPAGIAPEFAPKKKSIKLANHCSRVSKQRKVALLPAIQRIESVKYQAPDFKDAEELRAAFEEANAEVRTKAISAIDGQADVIIALAKVQAILSQRGKEKMRSEAGIDLTWTGYYKRFQKEFNFDLTLRAVQYKLAELAGKERNRKCDECRKSSGHATSCSKYKEPPLPHLTELEAKLLDAASRAHNIVKAVRHGGNIDEAIAEFERNAPTPEKLIEYADRSMQSSLGGLVTQLSKPIGNALDYRGMLVKLLDQIEKLGSRLPVDLHKKCKEYRSLMGLPPNVVSDPNWNRDIKQEEDSRDRWETPSSVDLGDGSPESFDSSGLESIEY